MSAGERGDAWYRHPLLWLGGFILVASLAGCIWMIVMAARYPDPPLETGSEHSFRVPLDSGARTPAPPR
jgi:hypothetical protein